MEAQAILDRLNSAHAQIASRLNSDLQQIQIDLDTIDRLTSEIDAVKVTSRDALYFLLRYNDMVQAVQRVLHKQTQTSSTSKVNPSDSENNSESQKDTLPREVASRKQKLSNYEAVCELVKSKDQILLHLATERDQLKQLHETQAKHLAQLDSVTQQEMQQWITLTDRFATELQEFKKCCRYCGVPLSGSSVNTYCKMNTKAMWRKEQAQNKLGTRHSEDLDDSPVSNRSGADDLSRSAPKPKAKVRFGERGSGVHLFEAPPHLAAAATAQHAATPSAAPNSRPTAAHV